MERRDSEDEKDGHQKEDIPAGYEEYLLLLQQRNRLLKKLKEKDKKQQDLERREQGFSLYLNGANVDLKLGKAGPQKSARKAKTAGENANRGQPSLSDFTDDHESESRAWTAPSKHSRKGWGKSPAQLKIKTEKGDKVEFKTGKITGKYSEDFEMYQSFLEQQLANDEDSNNDDDDDEEIEDPTDESARNTSITFKIEEEEEEESAADEVEDETEDDHVEDEKLTLTIKDVKALRRSLESNREIAESIRSIRENIESEDTDTDEDVEEDLETMKDTAMIDPSELPQLGKTLPKPISPEKKETAFGIGKSFDLTNAESFSDEKDEDHGPIEMVSAPRKSRPLSASRIRTDCSLSQVEKPSADVINAIRQENQQVAQNIKVERDSRSAPSERIKRTEESVKDDLPTRPTSIATGSVDDEMIVSIVDKVKNLNAKQQLNLLKILSRVEQMDLTEEDIAFNASFFGNKKQPSPKRNTLVEDTQSLEKNHKTQDSPSGRANTSSSMVDIPIESNISVDRNIVTASSAHPVAQRDAASGNVGNGSDAFNTATPGNTVTNNAYLCSNMISINPQSTVDTISANNAVKGTNAVVGTRNDMVSSKSATSAAKYDDVDGIAVKSIVDVNFEISSNWGNSDMVGLTEVEFFDDWGKRLHLKDSHIELSSSHICYAATRNLSNGKTKTTKEKYMWKCQLRENETVKLTFHVPVKEKTKSEFGISKIAVWNYNKSLYDLNIGAKQVIISINDQIIWEGIVEKGCGNQVFDYSRVIKLYEEEKPTTPEVQFDAPERCKTATLTRDPNVVANLPKIESIGGSKSGEPLMLEPKPPPINAKPRLSRGSPRSQRKTNSDVKLKSTDGDILQSRSVSTPNLSSSTENAAPFDPCRRYQQLTPDLENRPVSNSRDQTERSAEKMSSRPASSNHNSDSKPIWLSGSDENQPHKKPTVGEDSILPTTKPRSRPSSGRRALSAETADRADRKTRSPGRREKSRNEEGVEKDDLKPSVTPRRPRSRNQSPASDSKQTERKLYREKVDRELEQSFKSIDQFQHSHLGRITSNIDLEQQGDALDLLIQHSKPIEQIRESSCDLDDTLTADDHEDVLFEIPTLPKGQTLVLNLESTWGDRHYIGLNGIEVFTDTGELAQIDQITADPADINVLSEYDHDPRVVSNLIDGVYMTRDDMHLWLCPFTPGEDHIVKLKLNKHISIAMLRIWNYNKSRIHSTRGAKAVEVTLDGSVIFKGEIARASGILSKESEPYGDIILFTTDEDILEAVAKNDFTYEYDIADDEETMAQSVESERPKTADNSEKHEALERPFTCPKSREDLSSMHQAENESPNQRNMDLTGKVLTLNFTQTWGDEYYLGLTGIQILGNNFRPLDVQFEWMFASPRDLNDLEDYYDDDRTLDKLLDGENVTVSDEHMWLIPFVEGEDHIVSITFPEQTLFTGIRIWNYNKSSDDTYRGARCMQLYIDEREISPDGGFLLRKGPGHCHFDFAQDILFDQDDEDLEKIERARLAAEKREIVGRNQSFPDMETILLPSGFVFQLRLFSTWGDPYYIGLNGLELYDEHGEQITLDGNNVTAYPHSVNVLERIDNDVRTPNKLVDGVNDTFDASHMWMAPVFPGTVNVVYIVFDSPVSLSMIKLWNYSKTGARGVRQFGVLIDDLLVYNGVLPQVADHSRAILPTISMPVPHHTILFTVDEEILSKERNNLLSSISVTVDQDVQMTNDSSIVNPFTSPTSKSKLIDQANRPMTSVTKSRSKR